MPAMTHFAALLRLLAGFESQVTEKIDPNLALYCSRFAVRSVCHAFLPSTGASPTATLQKSVLAFEQIICERMQSFSVAFTENRQGILRFTGEPPGFGA